MFYRDVGVSFDLIPAPVDGDDYNNVFLRGDGSETGYTLSQMSVK